jgi:hypothetical protein
MDKNVKVILVRVKNLANNVVFVNVSDIAHCSVHKVPEPDAINKKELNFLASVFVKIISSLMQILNFSQGHSDAKVGSN